MAIGENGHFPFLGKEKFTITLACIDGDSITSKKAQWEELPHNVDPWVVMEIREVKKVAELQRRNYIMKQNSHLSLGYCITTVRLRDVPLHS